MLQVFKKHRVASKTARLRSTPQQLRLLRVSSGAVLRQRRRQPQLFFEPMACSSAYLRVSVSSAAGGACRTVDPIGRGGHTSANSGVHCPTLEDHEELDFDVRLRRYLRVLEQSQLESSAS